MKLQINATWSNLKNSKAFLLYFLQLTHFPYRWSFHPLPIINGPFPLSTSNVERISRLICVRISRCHLYPLLSISVHVSGSRRYKLNRQSINVKKRDVSRRHDDAANRSNEPLISDQTINREFLIFPLADAALSAIYFVCLLFDSRPRFRKNW